MLKIAKTPKDSKNKEEKKKSNPLLRLLHYCRHYIYIYISSQIHRNTGYSSPNGVSCRKILMHNYCIVSRNYHDPLIKIKTIDKSRKL
jgi:hypothetical protein